ncbi:MAG: DNRLRE domain-containing protein [Microcystis sp. M049S2]|uniref:DNRLRE domain-containing protein n=1 Tax=Microcystis sp. M049S2 TaxID=2771169 RepID=UPI0025906667|nr:DNRLRE domain-containing protein [Microcystis sp. M049S2]MCA2660661.1 DNRLRE domain-containing protein [Microcystis sp. M049S2]
MTLVNLIDFAGEDKNCLSKIAITSSVLAVSTFVIAPVQAATVNRTTAFGNGADTFVVNINPDTNFNAVDPTVAIKGDSTVIRKGYLRFDLNSINKSNISNAIFNWTYVDNNSTPPLSSYSVYGLNDGNAGENWNESTITWNNAPANGGGNTIDSSQTTFLGLFSFNPTSTPFGTIISFSDPKLVSFLQNDTNNLATLIITRDNFNVSTQNFAGKEATQFAPPTLQLEITPPPPVTSIPEPSSILGILSLGVLGIGAALKRKL